MVEVSATYSVIMMIIVFILLVSMTTFLTVFIHSQKPKVEVLDFVISGAECTSTDKLMIKGTLSTKQIEKNDPSKNVMIVLFHDNKIYTPSSATVSNKKILSNMMSLKDGNPVEFEFKKINGYVTLAFFEHNDDCENGVSSLDQKEFIEECSGFLLGKQSINCGNGGEIFIPARYGHNFFACTYLDTGRVTGQFNPTASCPTCSTNTKCHEHIWDSGSNCYIPLGGTDCTCSIRTGETTCRTLR